MHDEAFAYTRQTLGYPAPPLPRDRTLVDGHGPWTGDVEVAGGTFALGAEETEPFVFDNEKWAHAVTVPPFAHRARPVTAGEYAAFVDDGGTRGARSGRTRDGPGARRRGRAPPSLAPRGRRLGEADFDAWVPLEPHHPALHVGWFEAEAWCAWAGRRLPTEAEWEMAARTSPGPRGRAEGRRRFPWGDAPPSPSRANLDAAAGGCLDVAALPEGDSAWGCRQMIGNAWEWTASDFRPYPASLRDAYAEYSEPWFGTHKVLRGGCW